MVKVKLGSSCKSCGCTHTHTHGYNFIKINENELYFNRIGFVNNVKKYICSRLNLNKIEKFYL